MPFNFDEDEDMYPADQVTGPVISVRGGIRLADFEAKAAPHVFGGPLELAVRGVTKPAFHRVLTLSLSDPLLGFRINGLTKLPLIYGVTYNGCRLKYSLIDDGHIEMLELKPRKPASDWPYASYPVQFTRKTFALRDDGVIDPDQVHELTWQGVESADPKESVLAIVPPSEIYDVSLWGAGDGERAQVIFEIDPERRTVAAYNQCT